LIGIINKKTIIYKCIACNGVATRIPELDAVVVVVTGSIACNVVIAGIPEVDAVVVVGDSVACNVIA